MAGPSEVQLMLLLSYLATFQMCVSGHFEETRGGGLATGKGVPLTFSAVTEDRMKSRVENLNSV